MIASNKQDITMPTIASPLSTLLLFKYIIPEIKEIISKTILIRLNGNKTMDAKINAIIQQNKDFSATTQGDKKPKITENRKRAIISKGIIKDNLFRLLNLLSII